MTGSHVPSVLGAALLSGLVLVLASPAHGHIELNVPNGGEVLEAGSVFTISWRIAIAHNLQNWDLWFSTDNGMNWTPIVVDLPPGSSALGSVHAYDWIVPNCPSDQARVRVRMDNSGTDYFDESDTEFTIEGKVDVQDSVCPEPGPSADVSGPVMCGMGVLSLMLLSPGTLIIARLIRHRAGGGVRAM